MPSPSRPHKSARRPARDASTGVARRAPVRRFGPFELQLAERRLLADGAVVPLGARAFDLLQVLTERPGHLLTKDELLDRVWPGLVVEENNVAVQIVALRKALRGGFIETVPGHGYRFNGAVEVVGDDEPAAPSNGSAVLPTMASARHLFGRGDDLHRLRQALARPGCVTVVGVGGVGKTALARAMADAAAPPAVWVDLADLDDGAVLPGAVARAAGLSLAGGEPTAEALAGALDRQRLVVLDNAEHLREAVRTLVAALLAAAPALHLLVTSQAALGVRGEGVLDLQPLDPEAGSDSPQAALQDGAVGLLVARILAADYRQRLSVDDLPQLRRLCTDLDGLPLALEMAAARVPLLGLAGVHTALQDRLGLLRRGSAAAPARHRSLASALEWSYGLLQPEEQGLFRTLGVFAGGFTLELLTAVDGEATARWDVIDRLAVLVERSLVVTEPGTTPRYRLLESLRSFALQQLTDTGEAHAVRERHARALAALLRQALDERRAGLPDDRQPTLPRALAEMANARAAFSWALREQPALAVALAVDAAELTVFGTWRGETFRWMGACEPLLADAAVDPRLQAEWLLAMARQLLFRHQPRAAELAREACARFTALGEDDRALSAQVALVRAHHGPGEGLDTALQGLDALVRQREGPADDGDGPAPRALGGEQQLLVAGTRAYAHSVRGEYVLALARMRQEVELARALGRQAAMAAAHSRVIATLNQLSRHAEAVEEAQALLHQPGLVLDANAAFVHTYLLSSLCELGRLDEARQLAPEVLEVCLRLQVVYGAYCVAQVPALQGRVRAAARLLGHADRVSEEANARIAATLYEDTHARCRAALGERTLQRLRDEGRHLDRAAALALLRAEADPD